ncbi:MAG: hypothetical protein ACI9FJ_002179 [Alteromonadaceae bacterium]|jgi:hypothetical protein
MERLMGIDLSASYSVRLEVRGQWLITPANPQDKWDIDNSGRRIMIHSDSASDSNCKDKAAIDCLIKPTQNTISIHSGRVSKTSHPREIWGEVSVDIGLKTTSNMADILFIPIHQTLGTDCYISLYFPEKDDPIRFEEKRLHGYGEHWHGPFEQYHACGIKIRLVEDQPLPVQVRDRGLINNITD